jgi:hypothetical protein
MQQTKWQIIIYHKCKPLPPLLPSDHLEYLFTTNAVKDIHVLEDICHAWF